MKALRYGGPGVVEMDDLPQPKIGPDEVLVAVQACGVCATDVKTFRRGHPFISPGAVLGHEIAGVVAGVGAQVSSWSVGDAVVVAPYAPCDQCIYCRRGQFTLCERLFESGMDPGGFSEFIRVPRRLVEKALLRLPDGLSAAHGALTEPLACCFHGLEALEVGHGDSLLIIGDGPMGLLQSQVGRLLGAGPIVMSGMTPHRLAQGAETADVTVNVAEKSLGDVVQEVSGGAGMDKIIVSLGDAVVAQDALPLARRGATINFFAGMPKGAQVTVDANQIHYDQVRVLGTFGFAPSHFRRALDTLDSHRLNLDGYITDTVPLKAVQSALEAAAEYRGIKHMVQMGEDT